MNPPPTFLLSLPLSTVFFHYTHNGLSRLLSSYHWFYTTLVDKILRMVFMKNKTESWLSKQIIKGNQWTNKTRTQIKFVKEREQPLNWIKSERSMKINYLSSVESFPRSGWWIIDVSRNILSAYFTSSLQSVDSYSDLCVREMKA